MTQPDRLRFMAFAILSAVAGTVAVGIAALARAGLCIHRLGWFGDADQGMPGMAAGGTMPAETMCPALVYASLVAAILCLFALFSLIAMRPCASVLAVTAARIIVALRVGPLTALLCLAGGVPLTFALAVDGHVASSAPLIGAPLLLVAAALSALALVGSARIVLAIARRLAVTIIAAFQLLSPNAHRPWIALRAPFLVPAGVRLARRRPSRAPPLR
jgi:hypothetical protein